MPPPHPPTNYITELPPGFEPTPEEQSLLDLYGTVKQYEREAARLREAAAKAKLQAADERYQRELEARGDAPSQPGIGEDGQPEVRRKKKRKKKKATHQPTDNDDGDAAANASPDEGSDASDESDEDMSGDEGGKASLAARREAKLQQMREDIEEKKRKAVEEEEAAEALRLQHLEEANSAVSIPAVKRKKREVDGDTPAISLIANLQGQATPPSEFSKDLSMGKGSLTGTVVFPTNADGPAAASWTPPETASNPADGALEIELPDFEPLKLQEGSSNNTIAVKFTAPHESMRFSINIAGPGHRDYFDILFHFNPRHYQKGGQLVINDKQEGIWGSALEVPLSTLPLMFGDHACTLIVQINGDGFDVFLDGQHCARLEHRTQLPKEKCSLTLQFPSTDDYGSPEIWTVYRVWWGQKPSMASGDISGVAGVNMYSALHPKKLFVSGLTKLHSQPEAELRQAELERAFRKYGGSHGVAVITPLNATYAFVEVETERQADIALQEMASKYRLNRARRTKHEALQEERAAAEAANEGKLAETSEWD